MQNNKLKAFILFFWSRQISGDVLTKNEVKLSRIWEEDALKELDAKYLNDTKKNILLAIQQRSNVATSSSYLTIRRLLKVIPAAVLVLLLALGGISIYKMYFQPDIYVAQSANRRILLRDGSVVTLLQGAELTVQKSFSEDTRWVSLKGDAVFSVAKSEKNPFVVQAQNFSTKVLGTVFKISQSGNNKSVDLYEGKVAVSYEGTPISYLKPHQVWTNFGMDRTAVVYTKKTDVKSGKHLDAIESLSFNEVSFGSIINIIKNSYEINIIYPNDITFKKISAELKGSIDDNIEVLAFAVGLEVEKDNTHTYTLKKYKPFHK